MQGAEFDVATSAERLSEEIQRVGVIAGISSSTQRPAFLLQRSNDGISTQATADNLRAITATMRARLARRGRAFHRWGRQQPMPATLPHVCAVKYRDELEAERARANELSRLLEEVRRERDAEREEAGAKLVGVQTALAECEEARDKLQEECRRAR